MFITTTALFKKPPTRPNKKNPGFSAAALTVLFLKHRKSIGKKLCFSVVDLICQLNHYSQNWLVCCEEKQKKKRPPYLHYQKILMRNQEFFWAYHNWGAIIHQNWFSWGPLLRFFSFGMIQVWINDPRSLRLWHIKGNDEPALGKELLVLLMRHNPSDLGSLI